MKSLAVAIVCLVSAAAQAQEPPLPSAVRAACATEIEQHCGSALGPQAVLDCLRGNDQVSDHYCKNALRAAGQEKMEMPPRGHYDASKGNDKTPPPQ